MAQLEVITFPVEFEVRGIDDPCAGSPGNHFLNLSLCDLEIIIQEPSRIDWSALPAFAQILHCEIWEFDLLACLVLHTRSIGGILFSMSADRHTGQCKYRAEQKNETRMICRVQEAFGLSETWEETRQV
jgi:hypothetical protein